MFISIILILAVLIEPVINPDNVKPGDWFTPRVKNQKVVNVTQQEAFRQYICAIRTDQVWIEGCP